MTDPVRGPEPVRIPLRWRDLDNQGHVYNGVYLGLLDEARTVWLRRTLGLANPDEYVIARIEIDFLADLTLTPDGAAVDVDVQVTRVGSKSVTTAEVMRDGDGREVARAVCVLLLWDRTSRQTRPLTAAERELLGH